MTAVDDVVTALVTLTKSALGPTWQVLDGWDQHFEELGRNCVVIGFSATIGSPAVTSEIDVDDGGLDALVETVTVSCSAAVWDGDMTFTPKRAELTAMFTALRAALAADQKLGGFALDVWLAPNAQWYMTVSPAVDEGSPKANVEVDFAITATVHAS